MDASFREVLTGKWLVGGRRRLGVVAALGFMISGLIGGVIPVDAAEGHFAEEAAPPLSVVSEDPYTNPGTYHRTQVEPVSVAFGSTIVSVFQTGRAPDYGASNFGWAVSTDAGATWTDGFLPGTTIHATPPGRWQRVVDPAVAFDAKHNVWLIEGLGTTRVDGHRARVFVSLSSDGAESFSDPVVVARADAGQHFDKTWLSCDNFASSPFFGTCYSQWDDEDRDLRLHISTSSDGGLTWKEAAIRRDTHVLDGHPLVQPDGTVIMPIDQCCPTRIDAFISTDGGLSFSGHGTDYTGPLAIHSVRASKVRGKLRMSIEPPFISADVDASGNIYVVWPDCRYRHSGPDQRCLQNDIVMSTTHDGRHWTPVTRIPIDPRTSSVDHFLPAIVVDPATSASSAHIAIVYYFYPDAECTVSTCDLSVGIVSSADGGSTWSSQQIAGPFRNTWFPLTEAGYMVGDYVGISFVDGKVVPVFPVAAEGRCKLDDLTSCNVWTASATIPI